jgi:uncharacterized membrane protein
MDGLSILLPAAGSFLGTHFLLSHPLRRPLVEKVGEKGFMGLYSLVAFITLGATIWAYRAAPTTEPIWPVGDALWAVATVAMLLASVLLMGSLVRNPALAGTTTQAGAAEAKGVYAVTRHPMMWAFAIWGASHILIYPIAKNVILSGAIILLALVGAALQDRKKEQLDPDGWAAWEKRTSYVPFAAIATGRARLGGFGGHALGGGLVVWIAATWAHIPLAGWPAGIWRWLT